MRARMTGSERRKRRWHYRGGLCVLWMCAVLAAVLAVGFDGVGPDPDPSGAAIEGNGGDSAGPGEAGARPVSAGTRNVALAVMINPQVDQDLPPIDGPVADSGGDGPTGVGGIVAQASLASIILGPASVGGSAGPSGVSSISLSGVGDNISQSGVGRNISQAGVGDSIGQSGVVRRVRRFASSAGQADVGRRVRQRRYGSEAGQAASCRLIPRPHPRSNWRGLTPLALWSAKRQA